MVGILAILAIPASACAGAEGDATAADRAGRSITVFAAASLSESFTELGRAFEREEPGTTVTFSFGPSSELATQIAEGAPADVLAAADERTMAAATDSGAVAGEPAVFAGNELAIAVPAGNPAAVDGLGDFADPDLTIGLCADQVPCGVLAREALDRAGVRPSVDTDEPDVKALVAKIASDEIDAGLVYRTDVRAADDDIDGIALPADQRVSTRYPLATVADPAPAVAEAFVAFVVSPEGVAVLERFGFSAP